MIRKRCKNCKHIKSKHNDGYCSVNVQVGDRAIWHLCNCKEYVEEEYDPQEEKRKQKKWWDELHSKGKK